MTTFKVGDVVKLMSNGPDMTVHRIHDPEAEKFKWIECRWFVGGELMTDVFRAETLIHSAKKIVTGNPGRNEIEADTDQAKPGA